MTFDLRKYSFMMEKILPSLFSRSFFREQEMLRTTFPQCGWVRLFFEEDCRTSDEFISIQAFVAVWIMIGSVVLEFR